MMRLLLAALFCVAVVKAETGFEHLVKCLQNAPLSPSVAQQLSKFRPLPAKELEQHYNELLAATARYRAPTVPTHSWAGYKGPWIENHFVERFSSKPLSSFVGGSVVPLFVQWTDIHVYEMTTPADRRNKGIPAYAQLFSEVAALLRPDVVYVAVAQDDEGLASLARLRPNVLCISAGGFGHVAIPLIKGELPLLPPPRLGNHSTVVGFYGQSRPRLARNALLSDLTKMLQALRVPTVVRPSNDWAQLIGSTLFNLAPRGFGRTSFRLAEIVQLGRVPVYLYDDVPWLPYTSTSPLPLLSPAPAPAPGPGGVEANSSLLSGSSSNGNFLSFGLAARGGAGGTELLALAKRISALSAQAQAVAAATKGEGEEQQHEGDLGGMLGAAARARRWFTYEGVLEQLELFFADPGAAARAGAGAGEEGRGMLLCVRLPPKPH